jgi:hypothetical protein
VYIVWGYLALGKVQTERNMGVMIGTDLRSIDEIYDGTKQVFPHVQSCDGV